MLIVTGLAGEPQYAKSFKETAAALADAAALGASSFASSLARFDAAADVGEIVAGAQAKLQLR